MRHFVIPAGLLFAVSCTDVESEDILTSGMSAVIVATAHGDGQTRVDAILRVGGQTSNTFVELTADDTLTVAAGEAAAVPLVEYEIGALHGYAATLTGDSPETVHTVAFTRTVDAGAPATTIQLPAAFEVTAPAASSSRAADLTLTWTPAAEEPMELRASGDCVDFYQTTIEADTGTFTIPAGTLTQPDGAVTNCEVTFTFRRINTGTLDTGFGEGGIAQGIQQREVSTTSAP